MRKSKLQTINNRRFFLPLGVVGIAGLLLLLAWFAANPIAFADEHGEQPVKEHQQTESETGRAPQVQALACITQILGRVPSAPNDITTEERLRIVQECFGGNVGRSQGPGGIPGVPQLDEASRCALEVLGRIPTSRADLSPEEQALIAQRCFGGQRGGRQNVPSGAGVPDPKTLECIISVVGRTPQSPEDLTSDERRLVGQQCFGGRRGPGDSGQGGQPRGGESRGLSDEDLQCITNTIGRLPSGPEDLTNDEKRQLGRACFAGERGPGDGRGGPGGPPGGDGPDEATLACIQENLGRLPLGTEDMTNEEKRLIGKACFGGQRGPGGGGPGGGGPGDITEEELQCITDTIGRLPTGPDGMTNEEKRLVGRTCFAGQGGPGGGEDDGPTAEQMQCIIDTIGRAPTGPNDFSQEEKRLIGRACFRWRG